VIAERRYPGSARELNDTMQDFLRDSAVVVAQAGHFLLYQKEPGDPAVPCVANAEGRDEHGWIYEELGRFPDLSWELATRTIGAFRSDRTYFLVLVNDWQYVLNAAARSEFYARNARLPGTYVSCAAKLGNEVRLLTPTGPSDFFALAPYFSEQALRSKFKRRVRRLIDHNGMPPDVELSGSDGLTSCNLIDALGEKREIYCSSKQADCAAEMAQLVVDAHDLVACDTLVNFYPRVCKQFVEFGSEIAPRIFGTDIKKIVNIALPANRVSTEDDLFEGAEVAMHEF
jgi:hypothetical protein